MKESTHSRIRVLVRVITVTLSAVLAAILVIVALNFTDLEEAPDDSDLRLTYIGMPAAENAYLLFAMCAREICVPDDLKAQFEQFKETRDCDPEFAADFLAQNAEAVGLYQKALACTRGEQIPPESMAGLDLCSVDADQMHAFEVLAGVQIYSLRASGNEKEAFDETIALMRFGDVVKTSKDGYLGLLFGRAMQRLGRNLIDKFLVDTTLSPKELALYISQIEPFGDDPLALADAWRGEYADALRHVENVTEPAVSSRTLKSRLIYKPNETKKALVDYHRWLIENADRPYAELLFERTDDLGDKNPVLLTLSGNGFGKILLSVLLLPQQTYCGFTCYARSELSALRVLIALKCHKLQRGELPASLHELVPEYFETIPMDYFDGGPIKYNRDKKLVYCVGRDLEDTGGALEPDGKRRMNAPDPSWQIEF